jgi:DNA-binding NarL/FixJ family response regulator
MRVLIVDDHMLFAGGLANLLKLRGIDVVGTASDGYEALQMVRSSAPDIVLMDISMPRCGGLEATRLIKAEFPDVKIVMLTVSEGENDIFEAVKSGASGYLFKSVDADDLITMLEDLQRGEVAFSPGLTAKLLEEFRNQSASGSRLSQPLLMPRQMEVLKLVASGMTYKEVGSALFISERTVKYHMKQILDQLHLNNRSEVIAYAALMQISKIQ